MTKLPELPRKTPDLLNTSPAVTLRRLKALAAMHRKAADAYHQYGRADMAAQAQAAAERVDHMIDNFTA